MTQPPSTPTATLIQLLADALAPDDLRLVVLSLPDAPLWRADLPFEGVPRRQYAAQILTFLQDRAALTTAFFAALRAARPNRAAEITALEVDVLGPGSQAPDPLAAYRTQVRERADLLAEALCAPGAGRLSQVYVEVHLEPDDKVPQADRARLATVRRMEDALAQPDRRWALTGEAGSGKSTLLHHLALVLLETADAPLPVPLRVPDLQRGDTVLTAVERRYGASVAPQVARVAAQGRAVLLLDGLDEALDPDLARDAILSLCATAAACPVFVASRPEGYRRPGASFLRLQLRPLERPEQQRLLQQLGVAPAEAERALEALHRGQRMRRIAESPLLLTLAGLLLLEAPGRPLARRVDLYHQAVELLLRGGHRLDNAPKLRDPDAALAALGRLALALHAEAREVMPDHAVRAQLAEDPALAPGASRYAGDTRALLDDLSRTAGLFVPDHPARPSGWSFPHRTFREFLAARALADEVRRVGGVQACGLGSVLDRHIEAAKNRPALWSEVFALLTGLLPSGQPEALVRRLVEGGQEDRSLLFHMLADAESLQEETVWDVLGLASARGEWERRTQVLQTLPPLVGDPGVAVRLLGRFARGATHGADLWWAHLLLTEIAAGRLGDGADEDARAEAEDLAGRLYQEHRPEARRQALDLIEAKGWWKAIPAGQFWCGSTAETDPDRWDDEDHSEDQRHVVLDSSFDMLAVPVINTLYELFDPAHHTDLNTFKNLLPAAQGDLPVYNVSWYEAAAFARWLGCHLPAEEEWEYACRAGTQTRYWSGSDDQDLTDVGWVKRNSGGRLHPVAAPPTQRGHMHPWGLYDLHGGVWEWCRTLAMDVNAIHNSSRRGTTALGAAMRPRVIRGGCKDSDPDAARAATSTGATPSVRGDDLGFRILRYRDA